jgi:hypothetical protein
VPIAGLVSPMSDMIMSFLSPLIDCLEPVCDQPTPQAMKQVFDELELLGGNQVRKEAWADMKRALRVWCEGAPSLTEAVRSVRDRGRIVGRGQAWRSVSRPVLVKGQQFDECVVFAADKFKARELHVAMTRPESCLTIVSATSVLRPQ